MKNKKSNQHDPGLTFCARFAISFLSTKSPNSAETGLWISRAPSVHEPYGQLAGRPIDPLHRTQRSVRLAAITFRPAVHLARRHRPSRNGLSHANRERPAQMAEQLFWRVLEHLKEQTPGFAAGKRRGPPSVSRCHSCDRQHHDGTGGQLPDWPSTVAQAAAKTHMRLNLQSLLPSFVIVDTAAEHDNKRARELCADLKSGEIALFDKGYVDFGHLRDWMSGGVLVTRARNMVYEGCGKCPSPKT